MTKEEFKLVELLKNKAWNVFKPNQPFDVKRLSYLNFAIEVEDKTGNNISDTSVKRFFNLTLEDEIKKTKYKGIIAMYVLGEKEPNLPYRELEKYYVKFCKNQKIEEQPVRNKKFKAHLNRIKGTYESYIVQNRSKAIRKSIMLISEDGSTECKSSSTRTYSGQLEITPGGQIIILNFKTDDENFYFQTILQGAYDPGNEFLYGIFSGISTHFYPMSGRELLRRVGEENDYVNHEPDFIKISSNKFQNLAKEIPEFKDFFTGKRDNFVDNIEVIKLIEENTATNNKS